MSIKKFGVPEPAEAEVLDNPHDQKEENDDQEAQRDADADNA